MNGFLSQLLAVAVTLCITTFTLAADASSPSTIKQQAPTCSIGLFGSCFASTSTTTKSSSHGRFESFGGFKPGMMYYEQEQESCDEREGCNLDATGVVVGFDRYINISGHNRTDDFTDLGFQYAMIPVADWRSDQPFEGSNGQEIAAGEGRLRYHFVRFNIKRGHFLYLIRSQYLISSFGIGLAIPEASGTAKDWVGARQIRPTIGGKLGFQYPVTDRLDIGVATNWSVLWYGNAMMDSAFLSGYGINLSYRT